MAAQPRARPNLRPDHNGSQRAQFESNKKKIYASQRTCGICGKPVNFGYKFPHPLSPFLAMLGDNKREAEIVSPVSAIEKAVSNVMAKMQGAQVIHVHLNLDGREIGRVAVNAVNADNARRGR